MNKENTVFLFLSGFVLQFSVLYESQGINYYYLFIHFLTLLCEIKCKSLICLIFRHNLISED